MRNLFTMLNGEIFINMRREMLYLKAAMKYSIYYLNKSNEIPKLLTFLVNYVVYCETVGTVISSHVKISCFCLKAQLVFHWCLYNKIVYCCYRK